MSPPVRLTRLRVRLLAVAGNGPVLRPELKRDKYVLLPKVIGDGLVLLLGVVVDAERIPPLVLGKSRCVLPSVPAVDAYIPSSAKGGCRYLLLLA